MPDRQPEIITIWPDGAPGSEDWTGQEREMIFTPNGTMKVVRNITRPTLTAYLPDPSLANGTAVIICPGGAFHFLAYEHEGTEVAAWLNKRGVAAFLLRYRVFPTATEDEEFFKQSRQALMNPDRMAEVKSLVVPLAVADGQQAVRIVRKRAAEWGITQYRVGILGFSAGARVAAGVAMESDAETRPAFAAPIYGGMWEKFSVPAGVPPIFLAVAFDDALAADAVLELYSAWRAAGQRAELHIYSKGGHGFGMNKLDLPSDKWIDQFWDWLVAENFAS